MERARVAVIGGGVVGCSVLYHLALRGWSDAVLLEQDELTSGSTWHAAGNCPTFSTSWALMRMQAHSADLYRRLGADVGYPVGAHWNGSVRLAHTPERWTSSGTSSAWPARRGSTTPCSRPAELSRDIRSA